VFQATYSAAFSTSEHHARKEIIKLNHQHMVC